MGYGLIVTNDGSNTLYSQEFKQHYHNRRDGALNESFSKHIIPALQYHKDKKELNILDICFGIGYNTICTLHYIKKYNLNIKLNIYSPEFDTNLINSLKDFEYPQQLQEFKYIIDKLSNDLTYHDDNINIEIFNGDAREYIKVLKNIDIVYQDPFSSDVNRSLWTTEYFKDIAELLSDDAIITTYSVATPVRLSMYKNGLSIYEYTAKNTNKSTIALNKKDIDTNYKFVDMEIKMQRNKNAKPLYDKE